jgi:hypothetical protein
METDTVKVYQIPSAGDHARSRPASIGDLPFYEQSASYLHSTFPFPNYAFPIPDLAELP